MKIIDQIYINGQFVKPHGNDEVDIINPSTEEVIGKVILADEKDAQDAIAAAKEAFKTFSKTSVQERSMILQRLYEAVNAKLDVLTNAVIEEYGAPISWAGEFAAMAAESFLIAKETLHSFKFTEYIGSSKVVLEPAGVVAIISPWNANYLFISKIAYTIATGCTVVIKPSELSAIQTQLFTECIHEAQIPPGVVNIVTGVGEVVGTELIKHPDIDVISFTGSTSVGKAIRSGSVDTMKRIILEMGGKSPNIILDDADFSKAIPLAVMTCYMNNGQACIAGSRLIVPEHRLEEVKMLAKETAEAIKAGNPWDKDTLLGPIVTRQQYNRVQHYIGHGIKEGAELVTGGEGRPLQSKKGYFVKPTVFANVTMDMTIAKEEIFGPVLSILTYKTEEEAVEIANNTPYGLAAYISTPNLEKANKIASQIRAGRICINGLYDEPRAPFGGFKQSGFGRENGKWGMESYLEAKTILGYDNPEIKLEGFLG